MSVARAKIRAMQHDWFANLMGFSEGSYEWTRSRLAVEGDELVSTVNGKRYGIGGLTLPTLAKLRVQVDFPEGQRSTVRCVSGDVRAMHSDPELKRALFQVASQFNLLEMTGPGITGATRDPAAESIANGVTFDRQVPNLTSSVMRVAIADGTEFLLTAVRGPGTASFEGDAEWSIDATVVTSPRPNSNSIPSRAISVSTSLRSRSQRLPSLSPVTPWSNPESVAVNATSP